MRIGRLFIYWSRVSRRQFRPWSDGQWLLYLGHIGIGWSRNGRR